MEFHNVGHSTNADTDANANAHTDADANADPDTDADANTDADTNAGSTYSRASQRRFHRPRVSVAVTAVDSRTFSSDVALLSSGRSAHPSHVICYQRRPGNE